MPGFCRPRRPPDRRAGQRTLANRPVGTGAPAPPRRAIRARALRASADGPRLRTRFPASAGGSRPPAPNPPALRRSRLRAPPPGDSRMRPSSIRRRPPPAPPIPRIGWRFAPARPGSLRAPAAPPARPAARRFAPAPFEHPPTAPACAPDSPHRLAVRARPPRIPPRFGDPACAPRRRAIRACALRASADGPRLRPRFHALAGGSRPPAPDPSALRRPRLRAPPPDDSRPRPSSIRRRPPPARPIPRIGWRFAPARPESPRASANSPARPAAGRFAPAPRGPLQAEITHAPNPPAPRRPRLRTRFPASAGGSRPPAPNPPALRRPRLRAPPPGDSRLRAAGPRKRRSCPPRIPPRFGDPACAPLRAIRACAPRIPASGDHARLGALALAGAASGTLAQAGDAALSGLVFGPVALAPLGMALRRDFAAWRIARNRCG